MENDKIIIGLELSDGTCHYATEEMVRLSKMVSTLDAVVGLYDPHGCLLDDITEIKDYLNGVWEKFNEKINHN